VLTLVLNAKNPAILGSRLCRIPRYIATFLYEVTRLAVNFTELLISARIISIFERPSLGTSNKEMHK
jgi:hypothetical protein